MLKRHIDHIIPNQGEVTIQNKLDDDTWYFNPDNKIQLQLSNQKRKMYPRRNRKPVMRYTPS